MTLTFAPLQEQDLEAAVALLLSDSTTPELEHPEDLGRYRHALEEIRATGSDVIGAYDEGTLVGIGQFITFRHFENGAQLTCELEGIYVDPTRRSQGIGAQLLGHLEQMAKDAGCYRVQLTSNSVRERAHAFYRSLGYAQSHQGFRKAL